MRHTDDLKLIADLIRAGKTDAAERLTIVLAELETERDAHQRFEHEARWLLSHAQQLPCYVKTDEGDREDRPLVVKSASPADPNLEPCDYVLKDCPRLQSLLKGEFKGR